jgi:hypothetical protein
MASSSKMIRRLRICGGSSNEYRDCAVPRLHDQRGFGRTMYQAGQNLAGNCGRRANDSREGMNLGTVLADIRWTGAMLLQLLHVKHIA